MYDKVPFRLGSVIKITEHLRELLDDTYAEAGMLGRVLCVRSYDGLYDVDVDFASEFEEHNIQLEGTDWYLPGSYDLQSFRHEIPTGTAREAGLYPENGIETLYFGQECVGGPWFELVKGPAPVVPITIMQLADAYRLWKAGASELRFGQYLVNRYDVPSKIGEKEIFYSDDTAFVFETVAAAIFENKE